jgi:aryl-alcohol dehydrogenase-like predicted oxidoreductase
MKYRKFGSTDIDISAIALGCWAIGGGFTWGQQDENDSIDTIRAAVDLGVNMFDTAEFYNEGYSEEVLGKGLSGRRQNVLIATKVWVDNMTPQKLIQACEGSLMRLNTDYIDLYQIHWPNWDVPIEDTLNQMSKLKDSGKIRFIGVSNFGVQDLAEATTNTDIVTDQLAYSLLFRAIEFDILPACRKSDVGVLAYSPLAQGLLTGKFETLAAVDDERARLRLYSKDRSETVHDEAGCEKEVGEALAGIRAVCAELGEPMANVALAWVLQQEGITAVLAGARNPDQIRRNVQALDLELPQEAIKRLWDTTDKVKSIIGANADPWRTATRIR